MGDIDNSALARSVESKRLDYLICERPARIVHTEYTIDVMTNNILWNQELIAPEATLLKCNTQKDLGDLKAFSMMNKFIKTSSGNSVNRFLEASTQQNSWSSTWTLPDTSSDDEGKDRKACD